MQGGDNCPDNINQDKSSIFCAEIMINNMPCSLRDSAKLLNELRV